jgi:fibronectin-binding autotransporter adhesin
LVLADTAILAFELNPLDQTVGGGVNDLIDGVTNLTLDGLLNVSATSGSFAGVTTATWRLFNYSGTLTDNALALNSMPTLDAGASWQLDTGTANQVNLKIVPEPSATLLLGLGSLGLALRRRR